MKMDKSTVQRNYEPWYQPFFIKKIQRWWFTFNDDDWVKTCHSFWDLMRVKSESVDAAEKLIKKKGWGLGADQIISYLFGSFFMTVLPYDVFFLA
jgi:hypothetical protein